MQGSDGRLRSAVIGCGAIAHEHLKFLGASQLVDLAAVCDSSSALASFAAEKYGATEHFTDQQEMLSAVELDVVHVLTPPQTHVALVTQALEAKAHVICEKPLAPTAAEVASLIEVARANDRKLIESRNLLFNDEVLAVNRLLADGRLGDVREVDVLLSLDLTAGAFGDTNLSGPGVALPGGAVQDFLPHLAYLFLHFSGDAATLSSVSGELSNRSGNSRVGFDSLDMLVRTSTVRGRLRIASDTKPDMFRLVVRGSKASVEVDFYNPFLRFEGGAFIGKLAPLELIRSGFGLVRSGIGNYRNKIRQHGAYHGMQRMLEAIYRPLAAGLEPPINERQIQASADLVDRAVGLQQES